MPLVRTLAALTLALVACVPSDRADDASASTTPAATSATGPEPLVLRVPRDGGAARVHHYPNLDSIAWTATSALPAIARVLAFDEEGGGLVLTDARGRVGRIDLRLGTVSVPRDPELRGLASADGYAVFGIDRAGEVVRLTPTDERWRFDPDAPATGVFPQSNGWLLVAGRDGEATRVWRLRPPQTRIADSTILSRTGSTTATAVGDRLYFGAGAELLPMQGSDLASLTPIELDGPVAAVAATPSGDRVFVVEKGAREIAVVGRYEEDVVSRIELPGVVRDLRVDAYGRFLIARPASGDSAWVVALATGEVQGAVRTAWRADLPYVAPDGAIALASGADVVFVDGETLQRRRTVAGGAADLWFAFEWDGFRQRGQTDDGQMAEAATPREDPVAAAIDSIEQADSVAVPLTPPAAVSVDSAPAVARPGFIVSFAALLSEQSARDLATAIVVGDRRARVARSERSGTTIYRVLIGPYPTRAEAERVGQASGQSYWVYEETP